MMEQFVSKTLLLLEKEREAEIQEYRCLQENVSAKELQRRGICLLKLQIASRHTGLYGRMVLVFEPFVPGKQMPSHNFTPGDIAGLSVSEGEQQESIASGIVSRVSQNSISIAFDDSKDISSLDDGCQYKLMKLANDVTYKRLKKALNDLNKYRGGKCSSVISVLFGDSEVGPPYNSQRDGDIKQTQELQLLNKNLDESQQEAVKFALLQRELAVIHGPPGTGKTTTVVEIILQAIRQKLKILVCAPSNIAVDNLVERLANYKAKVIRLGHPARLLQNIQQYSLDAIVSASDEGKLVLDVRKDIDKTLTSLKKVKDKGERQKLREEMKYLRKEVRQREQGALKEILKRADVICATLTSATDDGPIKFLEDGHFDLVIIDECSQALEASCWIALLKGPKCILAGDHKQLPPTILSHEAAKLGLDKTLMERQIEMHGDTVVKMLTTQYRMNELIMQWSSDQLYEGKLKAHDSVAKHLLSDLKNVEKNEDTEIPLLLIDTAGCDLEELDTPEELSKGNEGEADLVTAHVDKLVQSGLSAEDIAVIAPYNLQVELIRLRLASKYPKLEIKSVDGFQGREKEAVVISLVRSNNKGVVGFLAEDRRINVAITRARRHLAVICDSETVGHHAFLKELVDYMSNHGEVRSAQQYIQEGIVTTSTARPSYLNEHLGQSKGGQGAKPKVKTNQKATRDKKKNKQNQLNVETKEKPKDAKAVEIERVMTDKEIEEICEHFSKDSSKQSYSFPKNLNSKERFIVHEVAEKLGLLHMSQGEGDDRHIVISKAPKKQAKEIQETVPSPKTSEDFLSMEKHTSKKKKHKKTKNTQEIRPSSQLNDVGQDPESICGAKKKVSCDIDVESDSTNDEMEAKEETRNENSVCDKCNKEMPSANLELHQLRCRGVIVNNAGVGSGQESAKQKKSKKKKSKSDQGGKHESAVAKIDDDDFDALIAAAVKENTVCNFKKCKQYTTCLGQNCPFCAKRFCLTHHIPEVHGCGDQAKSHARMLISREGKLYQGSGVPDKKPDPTKRAHMHRKLEKKLTEMADKRKTKNKEKGDK